jgi:hypothetical protein
MSFVKDKKLAMTGPEAGKTRAWSRSVAVGDWLRGSPLRRYGDVWSTAQSLDRGPLADVVSFHAMAQVLQKIACHETSGPPVPLLHDQERSARNRHRDAHQMDPEVERVTVPLAPVSKNFSYRPAPGGSRFGSRRA